MILYGARQDPTTTPQPDHDSRGVSELADAPAGGEGL